MFRNRLSLLAMLGAIAATAGCSKSTEVQIEPCTAAGLPVNLAVGAYASIDPTPDSGCTVFPATVTATEYLIVPQLATGTPGQTAAFRLGGDTIVPVAPPAPPAGGGFAPVSEAQRFHEFLRHGDEQRFWGFQPESPANRAGEGGGPFTAPAANPPTMGSLRTFQVCAKTDCSRFDRVGARVRALAGKVAIYVDTLAPPGGLDSATIESIADVFDTTLYAIDTAAFGRESDIDSNTVVLVLMTNTVNKMVTKTACTETGFVAGFFFGADIDPLFQNDSRSNKGEIFYSIVADPSGSLSCSHSAAELQALVPVTFIHEFQHMISFNQHVLERDGNGEVLWLNEGFSHYAEELGGRKFEASPTAPVADCTIGTAPCRFYAGNLLNAYMYLDTTSKHFLLATEGIGTLAERGASWLFVRYLVDQYASGTTLNDWNALTRSLVATTNTGAQNVAAVTGEPFATVVSRWALANWTSDIPSAPAELKYTSWNLHSVYSSLHTQRPTLFPKFFPLEPTVSDGRDVSLRGTLRAGSGTYHRATQVPGDPGFTLQFTTPNGGLINASLVPRLNVIRLQ